jgi:hypothetical protein
MGAGSTPNKVHAAYGIGWRVTHHPITSRARVFEGSSLGMLI